MEKLIIRKLNEGWEDSHPDKLFETTVIPCEGSRFRNYKVMKALRELGNDLGVIGHYPRKGFCEKASLAARRSKGYSKVLWAFLAGMSEVKTMAFSDTLTEAIFQ